MKPLRPDQARAEVSRKYERHRKAWIDDQGEWPLRISLGSVTEKEAVANWSSVRAWCEAWMRWGGPGAVQWVERRFPSVGSQRLPASLDIGSPSDAAFLAGAGGRYQLGKRRRDELVLRWPQLANGGASRHYDILADYPELDYRRLLSLLEWLEANPSSGLYLRQLPIEGLDTKWIGKRTGLVGELYRAIRPSAAGDDFLSLCGLASHPTHIRMRVLCPELRLLTGGLTDFYGRIDEIARSPLRPKCALVVENQQTGVALPQLEGVVCFQELGNAVSLLSSIPWMAEVPVLYWGDIDTHGFFILDQARLALPHARSILMDEATLMDHRSMCVEEPKQHPAALLTRLSDSEAAVYGGLRSGRWGDRLRLEQERVPWAYAMDRLELAIGELASRGGRLDAEMAAAR